MKIAVDVDGVIINLIDTFLKIFNQSYETNYKRSDITRWDFYKSWKVSEHEIYEIFYQIYDGGHSVPLIDKRIPRILKDINKNHHLDILSARNSTFEVKLAEILKKFNIVEGLSYREIKLVKEKPYDLKLNQKYDLFIDDNPNLVEPIKVMRDSTLFLYSQPWNKECICNKNVKRINKWREIPREINLLSKRIYNSAF